MRRLLSSSLVALTLIVSAPSALAEPPSMGDLKARVQEFYKVYEKAPRGDVQPTAEQIAEFEKLMADAAAKGLEGIDLKELDASQRRALQPIIMASPKAREEVRVMLSEKAKGKDLAGFEASVEMIDYADSPMGPPIDLINAAVDHPAAEEGVRAGKATNLMYALGWASEAAKAKADRLAVLAGALDSKAVDEAFFAAPTIAKVLVEALPKDKFEAIRSKLAAEASSRASKASAENVKKGLDRVAKRLNGAALKGELVGYPAPSMNFTWHKFGKDVSPWTKLEDLKGKVVVLDFWATWCGPCVGSFPQVRELRAAYPTSEVEMIGVTSIQGSVIHQKNNRGRVDCKGDPAKEKAELEIFAADMDVTWTIGITEEDVFNSDFGIDGIPFVAIIGPDGKVAKAGLHPMNHDEIKATIDSLLKKTAAK